MHLYTIGFSQRSAEEFFNTLVQNRVKKVIDIRLNNKSQLSGFANVKHLPYFLKLHHIEYEHKKEFAPSKELLQQYQKKQISFKEYIPIYQTLLENRKILKDLVIEEFENAVLLCSEFEANTCHRSILSKYLADNFTDIYIKHL